MENKIESIKSNTGTLKSLFFSIFSTFIPIILSILVYNYIPYSLLSYSTYIFIILILVNLILCIISSLFFIIREWCLNDYIIFSLTLTSTLIFLWWAAIINVHTPWWGYLAGLSIISILAFTISKMLSAKIQNYLSIQNIRMREYYKKSKNKKITDYEKKYFKDFFIFNNS